MTATDFKNMGQSKIESKEEKIIRAINLVNDLYCDQPYCSETDKCSRCELQELLENFFK